jgi:hypothetical protein
MKLKTIIFAGAVLLFAAGVRAGNSKLLLGTEAGLPGECEVGGYDVETGLVTLRQGSNSGTRPMDSFPTNVQAKIIGWAADEAFASSSGFKINATEQETKTDYPFCSEGFEGIVSDIHYDVTCENRSPFEMAGITVECRIFYKMDGGTVMQKCSRESFDLPPGGKKVWQTETVSIRNGKNVSTTMELGGGYFGSSSSAMVRHEKKIRDDVKGVCVLVRKAGFNGAPVFRKIKKGSIPKE